MVHDLRGDWEKYIQGTLSAEQQEKLEEQLLRSEEAMEQYLAALDKLNGELPILANPQAFTENVMSQICESGTKPVQIVTGQSRGRRWTRHPLFHYTIAASITMLLVMSGVFDSLLVEQKVFLEQPQGSISQYIMDQAFGWLDNLKR